MRIGFDLAEARAFFDGLSRCDSKEALIEMQDGQITISSPDSEGMVVARFVDALDDSFLPHDLQLFGFPKLSASDAETLLIEIEPANQRYRYNVRVSCV